MKTLEQDKMAPTDEPMPAKVETMRRLPRVRAGVRAGLSFEFTASANKASPKLMLAG